MEKKSQTQENHDWKNKNEKYLFEIQKLIDLIENIENEKLKKEILYQLIKYDKLITELAEERIVWKKNL